MSQVEKDKEGSGQKGIGKAVEKTTPVCFVLKARRTGTAT